MPTGQTTHGNKLKIATEVVNYRTSNPLWFENQQCVIMM